MSDNEQRVTVRGFSLFTILQAAFIILKVAKVIDWSWWAVLIPLWIELGIIVLGIIILLIISAVQR